MSEDGTREPATGRAPRNTRPRDALGRPLPYGATGTSQPEPQAQPQPRRSAGETLAQAQRLLDEGLPFHAHEVLEDAWKAAPPRERDLWRGLAQLAVGATHAARGNAVGADALVARGAALVARYAGTAPPGLDVAKVLTWAEDARHRIAGGMPAILDPIPLLPGTAQPGARG